MPAKKITTVEIAAMRSEFQRGYQSIVTSLVERKVCAAHGANNLEIFCRDMCVAKNTLRGESVFSPIYGRKARVGANPILSKKGVALF